MAINIYLLQEHLIMPIKIVLERKNWWVIWRQWKGPIFKKNRLVLRVIIDKNNVIYKNKLSSQQIFDNNCSEKEKKVKEDFICFIKKEYFDKGKKNENNEYTVKIEFDHEDNKFWKDGCLLMEELEGNFSQNGWLNCYNK